METNLPETFETLEKAFTYFKQSFKNSSRARDYIKNERSLDIETLQALGIEFGYNSGTYYQNLSEAEKQACENAGLLVPKQNGSTGSYTVWAKDCIIFPLRSKDGKLTGLYGRLTGNKKGYNHYLLRNCKGLLRYPAGTTKQLIITEGNIDALTLLQIEEIRSKYDILPIHGTNGFTGEVKEYIKSLSLLTEVVLFFDGDQAGFNAAEKYKDEFAEILPDLEVSTVMSPDGEDVNSLYVGHSPELFTSLLDQRLSLIEKKPVADEKEFYNRLDELMNFDTKNPNKIIYTTRTANYYIKGGLRKELDNMRVSIDIENKDTKLKKREKLDLYIDKHVEKLAREASEKLDLRADIIEADLNKLTDLLDNYREQELLPEDEQETARKKRHVKVPAHIAERCIRFLKSPGLISQLSKKITEAGLIGEKRNSMLVFCIASSSKMPDTLHGIIQGSTGKGKTYLMNTICSMMPPEYYIPLTTMTDKSLFNNGKYDIQFHLIAIEDRDSMTDEVRLYFRELTSKEEISRHVTRADKDGNYKTVLQVVLGPIASLSCTTNGDLYPDDANRCFLISVDESDEQMKRIIEYRNKKAAGLIDKKKENEAREFIQNCIRMLKPYEVLNPYATEIHLPEDAKDLIRLHDLFIRLVKQITLLHQFQRRKDGQGRLITEIQDVETAVNVMFDAIVIKVDDLNEKQRKFFENLKAFIKKAAVENYKDYQFKQREIRMSLTLSGSSVKNYVRELVELEYIEIVSLNEKRGNIYKISCWDNAQALRNRIKSYLQQQIDTIKNKSVGKSGQK